MPRLVRQPIYGHLVTPTGATIYFNEISQASNSAKPLQWMIDYLKDIGTTESKELLAVFQYYMQFDLDRAHRISSDEIERAEAELNRFNERYAGRAGLVGQAFNWWVGAFQEAEFNCSWVVLLGSISHRSESHFTAADFCHD